MKRKLISFVIIFTLIFTTVPMHHLVVFAEDNGISISEENFPDDYFRSYVQENYDLDDNQFFSKEEIEKVTYILISPYDEGIHIKDYTGLHLFTSLKRLMIAQCKLTALPKLPESIEYLDCSSNRMEGILDVSMYSHLKELNCASNDLSGIRLSPIAVYDRLSVRYNRIQSYADVVGQTIPWDDNNYEFVYQNAPFVLTVTEENFPDKTFREHIISLSPYQNGKFSVEDLEKLNLLPLRNMGIQDLTGVEYLTGVKYLSCEGNNLHTLPKLPDSLNTLDCRNNQLTELPDLPPNMTTLYCQQNQLTSLPDLPDTLAKLICQNNQLTELPNLPQSLTEIDCQNNQLTVLPALPKNMKQLNCSNNQILSLGVLPEKLYELKCSNNQLTSIPSLPKKLVYLYCDFNKIQGILDFRGNGLSVLKCDHNELTGIILNERYGAPVVNVDQNLLESKEYILTAEELEWGVWDESTNPDDTYYSEKSYYGTQKQDNCTYVAETILAPSCEDIGQLKLTCTDCAVTRIKPILPTGHAPVVYKEFQPATWTDYGWHEGTICGTCEKILRGAVEIGNVATPKLSYTKAVYNGEIKKPSVQVFEQRGLPLRENDHYTLNYASGRKNVGRYGVTVTLKGSYSGKKTVYFTIVPKKPASATAKLRTISGGYDDVRFEWTKSVGATGYLVYYKKSSADKYTFYKSTTGTYVTKNNLTDGTKYTFKVIPYYKTKTGTTKYYSTAQYKTATITTLKKLNQPKVAKSGTKVKVTWNNIAGETGYEISRSTKKTGTNIVKTVKTTSGKYTTVSATKGTTYYYKVRAYKLVGKTKVFGPWSTVKAYKR